MIDDIDKKAEEYLELYKQVDFQPFIVSNIFLKELIYFQDLDYLQNKFNIIENTFLLKLLYLNLKKTKQNIKTSDYNIDPSEIYHKYNLKTLIKYNGKFKFTTYYNQWIRKIKLEYAKKLKESRMELSFDFNLY